MGIMTLHLVTAWDVPGLMRDAEDRDPLATLILCGCSYFKDEGLPHAHCAVCEAPLGLDWPFMIGVGLIEDEDKLMLAGMCVPCGQKPNPHRRFKTALAKHGNMTALTVHPAVGHA